MSEDRVRPAPVERFDFESALFDLHAEAEAIRREPRPWRGGHRQKALFKHEARTIALFVMEPGGAMPEHAAAGTVTVQTIEGEIEVTLGENASQGSRRMPAGALLVLAPETRHSVRALAASVFLLQVSLGS